MLGFRQVANKLLWEGDYGKLHIESWGRDSLRIRATMSAEIRDDLFSVLISPAESEALITIGEGGATISNGAITASVSPEGYLNFTSTSNGTELLAEKQPVRSTRIPPRSFKGLTGDLFQLEAHFKAYEDERFYGLGQHQHGLFNQKGAVIDLIQRNTEVSIPFLFSSRGYGFLWHNPAVGRVELGTNETRWVANATQQLDYWITTGSTPAEIMEHYADATGYAPEFPEWGAGFWQSKLRYRTQDELLEVAREYKRRGLPLSVIVVDFFHWTLQGDWRFDPKLWPDPAAMTRELEEMGVKVMVSIWPTVNPLSENFASMQKRGLLIRTDRGISASMSFQDNRPEGPIYLHYYDATNPEARQFIWEQVHEHYVTNGVKAWWLDACEPEMFPMDPDNLRFHLGNGSVVANAYPLLHEQGFYEHMLASGENEVLSLCRSAWAGSQRYGAAVWSGDIHSTFEALSMQVRAGLNMALSGIPWWTTDIGGFYGGVPESPSFRELVVRWFQYSAFCPLFRLHGYRLSSTDPHTMIHTGGPNEVWSFGEEAYEIIKDLLFLRERLRPYLMEQMQLAHTRGIPPMRPLFFDFDGDEECADIEDQFMLGPDLLVAPILFEGARSREVYLPFGTSWRDAWTGQAYEGGQEVTVEAPLQHIPLFLRGDAELPIRTGA